MADFSYRARGKDGREIRGVIQAKNEVEAVCKIREHYPVLLKLRQKPEKRKYDNILDMELGEKKICAKELSILCSQLAMTLRAGIPAAQALRMAAEQCSSRKAKQMMEGAAKEVAAGSNLADAFERYREWVTPIFIETVRAGECSGDYDRSFERLHEFYKKSYQTTEKVKNAMTYPAFVAIVAVIVLIVVMTQVIPAVADIITGLGGELPQITKILISIVGFLTNWWLLIVIFLTTIAIAFQIFTRTQRGRVWKARVVLALPYIGAWSRMNASAQFAAAMAMLIEAGIPLEQAMTTAAKAAAHAALEEEVRSMRDKIVQGHKISECMRKCHSFSMVVTDMCAVGEETGELETALKRAAEYCSSAAEFRSQRLLTMLEPALFIFLSIFAGFIIFAVYLPIFEMYELM